MSLFVAVSAAVAAANAVVAIDVEAAMARKLKPGNTKGVSIIVLLTSCLTG
jgi:hypothetical protein